MTSKEFVADRIRQLVEAAPPLPPEAREVIRRLMRPASGQLPSTGQPGRVA